MNNTLIKNCNTLALLHLPKHPQYAYYPHYSFIIQHNTLIEWGTNMAGLPPAHFGYQSQSRAPKLHAEFVAYRKARGLLTTKPFEVYNIRLNRQGSVKLSAPCGVCQQWLASVGCSIVWFTTDYGIGKIRL